MTRSVKKAARVEPDFVDFTRRIALLADDHKAVDIRAYDVRGLTLIADSFVICTATSEPHVRAVYNAIVMGMQEAGLKPLHKEGGYSNGWVVLDYGSIVVHIFRKESREYYDLDGLWGDAPAIALGLNE